MIRPGKNRHLFLLTLGIYSLFLSKLFAQNSLDLAGLTNANPATVAFSMRKLSSGYSGSAIQVRRSSDNTTLDIGFTSGGDFDLNSLKAFVGSGSGFISIWYDQSGNNRNLTQTSLNNQPRIVNSGIADLENNRPFIRFFHPEYTANYNYLSLPAEINQVGMVSTVNKFAAGGRGFLLGHTTFYYWHDEPPRLFRPGLASASVLGSTVYQNGKAATGSTAVWNTSLMVNSISPSNPSSGTAWNNIGRDRIYNQTTLGSGYTELIVFPSNPGSSERLNLERNQGVYYNIPIAGYNLNRFGGLTTTPSEMVNRFGASSAAGLMFNGETVAKAVPATPTTSDLVLGTGTANLTVSVGVNDGSNITAGICWGTSANPTTADARTGATLNGTSLTATMTSLTNGTTYYVRSYVTNAVGTVYGNEISFTF